MVTLTWHTRKGGGQVEHFEADRIGATIRAIRRAKGMSAEMLTETARLTCGHLDQVEDGRQLPCPGAVKRIAAALSVPTLAIAYVDALRSRSACSSISVGTASRSAALSILPSE